MTEPTVGMAARPPMATVRMGTPRSAANFSSRLDFVEVRRLQLVSLAPEPGAGRRGLAALVPTGEQTAREGEETRPLAALFGLGRLVTAGLALVLPVGRRLLAVGGGLLSVLAVRLLMGLRLVLLGIGQ